MNSEAHDRDRKSSNSNNSNSRKSVRFAETPDLEHRSRPQSAEITDHNILIRDSQSKLRFTADSKIVVVKSNTSPASLWDCDSGRFVCQLTPNLSLHSDIACVAGADNKQLIVGLGTMTSEQKTSRIQVRKTSHWVFIN